MRVYIQNNYDSLSELVARYVKHRIITYNPTKTRPFVLGLPTGSSPIGVYKRLVHYYKRGEISFENVVTFNMDEYVGLSRDDVSSYSYFMWHHLFSHINIQEENINLLDGCAEDLERECTDYEKKIERLGGINLFIAGIGTDGHLAFNEPGSSFASKTRIKTLCSETINYNSKFFTNTVVPTLVLTVGLSTILDADEVVLIANGIHKSNALKMCIEGPLSHTHTVSSLQLHKNVMIVCDRESTEQLTFKTIKYYDNLQRITDVMGKPNIDAIDKYISSNDKIIIFSPHPDDDVIGLGGTMQKLNIENVKVVYMTDGGNGFDKSKYTYNPRPLETILALKVLGYNKSNIEFLELPFYKTKKITDIDYNMISELLASYNPDHIFVCQDADPHKTHIKCYDIIKHSIFNKQLRNVWLYNSIWGTWSNTFNATSYIDSELYKLKLISIMMHDSQDPPQVFYENNDTPFHDAIVSINKSPYQSIMYTEYFNRIEPDTFKTLVQ